MKRLESLLGNTGKILTGAFVAGQLLSSSPAPSETYYTSVELPKYTIEKDLDEDESSDEEKVYVVGVEKRVTNESGKNTMVLVDTYRIKMEYIDDEDHRIVKDKILKTLDREPEDLYFGGDSGKDIFYVLEYTEAEIQDDAELDKPEENKKKQFGKYVMRHSGGLSYSSASLEGYYDSMPSD